MSRQLHFLCGTPESECTGGLLKTDQHFSTKRCHSTRSEAFRCYVSHLKKHGASEVEGSKREFRLPEGGILVLPKITKFGGRLRLGKEGRFMPGNGKTGDLCGLVF